MNDSPPVSPLELLENYFGAKPTRAAVLKMTVRELDELSDRVNELSVAIGYAADPEPDLLTYPGGWLAGNWHQQVVRGDLSLSLLYYQKLLLHDPLAEFFFRDWHKVPEMRRLTARSGGLQLDMGPRMWAEGGSYTAMRDNPEAAKGMLATLVDCLSDLAPLLRAGVVVTRPQWPVIIDRAQALLASTRHDVRDPEMAAVAASANAGSSDDQLPAWDTIKGLGLEPSGGFRTSDEPWRWQYHFFHLAKTLALSEAVRAQYAPHSESELRLLAAKAAQLGLPRGDNSRPTKVLGEVARVLLPDMTLTMRQAVDIRQSEDSFDEWRRAVRLLALDAKADDEVQLRQRVEDELTPIANRARDTSNRSAHLQSTLKSDSAITILTTASGAGVAAASGGSALVALGSGGASGALSWLWKALHPPTLTGPDAVVAALIRK